jgi:hypothetical protein
MWAPLYGYIQVVTETITLDSIKIGPSLYFFYLFICLRIVSLYTFLSTGLDHWRSNSAIHGMEKKLYAEYSFG